MRFVARLASSPRVTTLELPRPSTRDDPPPSVDPPPTAAALDLSDALDDDDDTDRDGLGFFARAPASSRRRRAGISEKAPPQKSASPSRASSRAPMRVRADARAPTPPKSKSSLDDDDDDAPSRAVDSRRRARRGSSLKRTATALRRAVRPSRPPARRARRVRTRAARASPAVRRRFVYRRRAARPLTTREDEPSSARPNFPYVRTDTLPPYESVRIPRSRGGRDESDSSRASREPIETLDPSARALEREAIRARARRPAHDDAPHERCLDEVKENPARRLRADPPRRACNSRSAGSRAT